MATLANVTLGSQTVRIENSGTIATDVLGNVALASGSLAGGPAANVAVEISNSGTIQLNAGAISTYNGPGLTDVAVSAGLVAAAGASGTSTITINNMASGRIEATGNLRQGYDGTAIPGGNPVVAGATPGFGSVALGVLGGNVTINNAGQITGGAGSTFRADQALYTSFGDVDGLDDRLGFDGDADFASYLPDRYLAGAIQTFGSTDVLENAAIGVITGSIDLGALNDTINNRGVINGNVFLRDGDDRYNNLFDSRLVGSIDAGAGDDQVYNGGAMQGNVFLRDGNDAFGQNVARQAAFQGIVDGGAGTDELQVDAYEATGQAFNFTPFTNFEKLFVFGINSNTDKVNISGALAFQTIDLQDATLMVNVGQTLSTTGPTTITGSDYRDGVINNGAITGNVILGAGEDVVSGSGAFGGNVDLGSGAGRLTLGAGGTIAGNVSFGPGYVLNDFIYREDLLENAGTISGAVSLNDGINRVVNSGTLASTLSFGNGLNTLNNSGSIAQDVDMGQGPSSVTNSGSILGAITFRGVGPLIDLADGRAYGGTSFGAVTNEVTNLASGTIGAITFADVPYTLTNAGTITGTLTLGSGTGRVDNSGTIRGVVANGSAFENRAGGSVLGALSNSGTLTNAGTLAAVSNAAAGSFSNLASGVAGAVTNTGTATNAGTVASVTNAGGAFSNSGTVTGGAAVSGGVLTTSGTISGGLTNSATVNANGGAINGAVANNAGGVINIGGTVTSDSTFQNTNATAALNINSGTYTIGGLLTNAGGIVVEGGATLVDRAGLVNTATGTILVKAGGTLIDALDNAGSVTNSGAYTADVNNSTATGVVTNTATGVWTGNLLSNTTGAAVTNLGRWTGAASNAASLTNNGTWTGAVSNDQGGTLANAGAINGAVSNAGTFNNAVAGGVSGLVTNTGGTTTNAGTLSGGATVNGGVLANSGSIAGATNIGSSGQLDNSGILSGAVTNAGTLNQSGGMIANTLTNTGTVNATGGALNAAVANNAGGIINVNGTVSGSGSLTNNGTINFASGALTLAGAATNTGTMNFNGGALGASSLTNASTGQITGTLNFTGGADNLINEGRIAGDVVLGAGDDIVTIRPGGTFGAGVNAGAGNDILLLALNGTELAPSALQLDPFTGFEVLRHTSGVSSLAGPFSIGAIEVNGGRLIGLAGSTITAPSITIASGATFGSAGRVVGNITNNGTLSPGASPGTMTVTGNVSLASGSTTLFELTPTVSDQLLISGTLSIANSATLNLTGNRPLTPGSTLDLIVADGGITGSFGTINKPGSILGFVAQRGNRIQLLGQFATDAGFGAQANATIGYVNSVLVAGQGSSALLNALPSLLTTAGGTSGAAFTLISPEAYASATQIGQENGMALSTALRSSIRSQARTGPFVFGQALGNWRQFRGDVALGTSRGNVSSTGFFGGLGIGGEMASFGAFAGYVDGRQRIGALGAKTDADGMVFGLTGSLSSGNLEASASLVHDGSKASTRRALPGGGATSANYKLKGLTADVSVGYVLPVGGNWAAKPEIGFTHVTTRRGAVSETGSAAFDLAVLKQKTNATFVDAGITLMGGQDNAATIKPWLTAGVRHQLGGDGTSATGGFKGINATYTVAGVDRRETLLSLGAGLSAQLSEGVSFNAGYRGEFGKGNAGHNVSAGIKVGF